MKTLKKIESFDISELERLLAPVWETSEILRETGLVVGEEGSVKLLKTPTHGCVEVKNIFGDVLYEEGVDYTLDGDKIKRIEGGALPFFAVDDYFRKEPNAHVKLKVNPEKVEFSFPEDRYIYFSECVDCFERYITVSYRVEEEDVDVENCLIVGDNRVQGFVEKLRAGKNANILLYGDSITVGCNATGTQYGGNVSPYQPDWNTLVRLYLEKKFGVEISVRNEAVGGWSSINGIDSFEVKCADALETTDLFCIGFGANDLHTEPEHFKKNLAGMIDGYFEKNPNGNVLLYSCLLPNNQATGWRANQPLFEQALIDLANDYDRVGVAKVSKVFLWVEGQGKKTRDFLANSVNHPNDFGVRIYAQTLLKTILGDEFV